jgi:alpha-1,2-mannosyltransferase
MRSSADAPTRPPYVPHERPVGSGLTLWWRVWVPTLTSVAAFLVRLIPVLRGGGIFGQDTYDPSVYYAAAVGLFSGRMPYRDFLLLHPPGILLALQPFAAFGAVAGDPLAMATARVAFMLMGAGSTFLIYRILLPQHRFGALIGAGAYAVWYPAIFAERSVRLEALASFLVLVGIVLIQRYLSRPSWVLMVAAGALFGLGASVKIWGIVPVAVLLAWLVWRQGWRAAALALLGALGAVAVVVVPFALAGPEMWTMTVQDQWGRARSAEALVTRLVDILGFRFLPRPIGLGWMLVLAPTTMTATWLSWRSRIGELFVLLTLATAAVLVAAPVLFTHYPAFVAAPLCLVYGTAVGELADGASWHSVGRVMLAIMMAGVIVQGGAMLSREVGGRPIGHHLAALLANRPGCVTTDNPTTLIFSNTLRRNLAAGCPLVVDLSGYIYDLDRTGGPAHRASNPAFQRFALDYLGSGTTTALIRLGPEDLSPDSIKAIDSWPVVGKYGPLVVRQPTH